MEEPRLRVLVVEDEYEIAIDIARHLESAGCLVLGPVGSVASAFAIIEERRIDAVTLDIRLRHGETAYPLLRVLRARGIPFAVTSGYSWKDIKARAADAVLIPKPCGRAEIASWVRSLQQRAERRVS